MYCVIQEIKLKKPNLHGHQKTLESYTITLDGTNRYYYHYTGERFDRPIRTAYKISIHESKRVNGVVTKQQYAVTTVSYYDLVEYWIGDCLLEKKLEDIAVKLNTDLEHIWSLINAKVDPLQERIQSEYKKTKEYKTHTKHEKIIKKHFKEKSKFAQIYNCDESEYDFCYDVFGELKNHTYLDRIIEKYMRDRSYQKQSYSNYSNYDWSGFNNNYSSYFNSNSSTYSDSEKAMLKKFYRTLSKEFHPDVTVGDGEEMQLINKLKEAWGL